MRSLTVLLDPDTHQDLVDLADAQGRTPEQVLEEAVRRYLRAEELGVRRTAERLAQAHADLLRRLGE
ncbi:CopG family ribbon-helix-helix protein [Streptomyces sp. NPDC004561]